MQMKKTQRSIRRPSTRMIVVYSVSSLKQSQKCSSSLLLRENANVATRLRIDETEWLSMHCTIAVLNAWIAALMKRHAQSRNPSWTHDDHIPLSLSSASRKHASDQSSEMETCWRSVHLEEFSINMVGRWSSIACTYTVSWRDQVNLS